MRNAATVTRIGGYQGERSVHTRALRALVAGLAAPDFAAAADLEIDVTASGSTAQALFDAVERGERQVCYMASGYLTARVPELAVLDLPFGVADRARAMAALDGAAGALLRDAVGRATGYRVLAFWDNGFRHVSNRRHPIRRPDDCQGLVIRTLDNRIYQDTLAAMGFSPRVIDVRDFRRAVAEGAVDAQENPLTNVLNFGLAAYHPFVSLTGHLFGIALLACHAGWFDRLTPAGHERLGSAVRAATARQRAWAALEDEDALAALRAAGVQVLDAEAIDRAAFAAACADVGRRATTRLGEDITRSYFG